MQVLKFAAAALILIGFPTGFWRGLTDALLGPWMSGAYPSAVPAPVAVLVLVVALLPFLLLSKLGSKK